MVIVVAPEVPVTVWVAGVVAAAADRRDADGEEDRQLDLDRRRAMVPDRVTVTTRPAPGLVTASETP